ncbi:hypothetical protein [Streptomyces sp. NPDC101178]|uniref:hypothetical protein n=1 Tax=Streptomyces sp. NPDC101178 TaxID=3366124 RepID=UPI0037F6C091
MITSVCAAAALSAVLLGAGAVAGADTAPAGGTHTTASAPVSLGGTGTPAGRLSGSTPNGNIWGP